MTGSDVLSGYHSLKCAHEHTGEIRAYARCAEMLRQEQVCMVCSGLEKHMIADDGQVCPVAKIEAAAKGETR